MTEIMGNLGLMYVNGWGVQQDYVVAHMWFNLAAAGGLRKALTDRELVVAKMTPEQVAEAEKRLAEWRRGGLTASRFTELETPGL